MTKELIKRPDMRKYRKMKIEKLGEDAMKLVMDSVVKGRSYSKIADTLTEIYKRPVTKRDVHLVLKDNAKFMMEQRDRLNKADLIRANLVLNQYKPLVEGMAKMGTAMEQLGEKLKKAVATKDVVEVSRAIAEISMKQMSMVKNYKKLTGQFVESPPVMIDQSKKQLNIFSSDSTASDKLAKELARADFKTPKNIEVKKEVTPVSDKEEEELDNEVGEVIDAEFKVEEKAED